MAATSPRLTFPAPSRCCDRTGEEYRDKTQWIFANRTKSDTKHEEVQGELRKVRYEQPLFASRPYEEADVLRTLAHGGWFDFPSTAFASPKVAQFAREAQATMEELNHA